MPTGEIVFCNRQWLGLGLRCRWKKQYLHFLTLRQCARRNGEELFVREFGDRQISPIDHLRGLSIQPVRDFANSGKFAFLASSADLTGVALED